MKQDYKSYAKYLIMGLILFIIPVLQQFGIIFNTSSITIIGIVCFYSIAGIGLNILFGYSGLISLGTAGFMGLGAYLSGYLVEIVGVNFFIALIITLIVTPILGLLLGLISLRLEGYYLAIATLAVSEVLKSIFIELEWFTKGFSGFLVSYPKVFSNFNFFGKQTPKIMMYYFVVLMLVLVLVLTHNFVNSSTGRALLTIKGSEVAAKAMGINVFKYKVIAFVISTLYVTLAGVLYMFFIRSSYPSTWSLNLSLQILAIVVIGGSRTIAGPVIGSIIVFGVPELIFKQIPFLSRIDGLSYIFTGLLIIVVILFYPNGLIYIGNDIKRLTGKSKISKG